MHQKQHPNKYIVLDVETANRNRASICQIGLVVVSNNTITARHSIFVNPCEDFEQYNTQIHGITSSAVENSPTFQAIGPKLCGIMQQVPIIQQGTFDSEAFSEAIKKHNLPPVEFIWINAIDIFSRTWPELKSQGYKLGALAKHFGIRETHHDALNDALATAKLAKFAMSLTDTTITDWLNPETAIRQISGPNTGKIIVFTGNLGIPKGEYTRIAEASGFIVKNTITKKVDILVVGELTEATTSIGNAKSGKHTKAEELQNQGHWIEIWNKSKFLDATDI